jgi:hypothetical protein
MDSTQIAGSLSQTLLLLVLVVLVSYPTAVWRLRRFHHDAWRDLGEPKVFGSLFAPSTWKLTWFALSFRHLRLDDLTLSLACVGFTLSVLAVLAALVGVVMWTLNGGA